MRTRTIDRIVGVGRKAIGFAVYFGGGGWLLGALQGNKHPEYHYDGMVQQDPYDNSVIHKQEIHKQERVVYEESNRFNPFNWGYDGRLIVERLDGYRLVFDDKNNNLKVDGGDTISIRGKGGSVLRFVVDLSNPNIASIAEELQPKIDATLERILQQNTAALREW